MSETKKQTSNQVMGILCILGAAFFFASMGLFVRLAGDLPSIQKSFFRNLIAFFIALVPVLKSGVRFTGKKENWFYLIMRAACGTIGILGNFYAIDHLVIADASILNKLSPFFAIIFSFFLLKEKIKPMQAFFLIGAFIGALFIIKPTGENMQVIPALVGFVGGAMAGAAYTCVRKLSMLGEKGPCIVLFFSGFSCMVTLPFLILDFHPMSLQQLLMLILAGASAAGGQFTITAAYSYAPARELSVYDYSQIIFSALLGFIFLGQIPDILSFLGYAIIILMAVLMFFYNKKQPVRA